MGVTSETNTGHISAQIALSGINKELLEETKTNNMVTSRQNWLTLLLTFVIILVGACTSLLPVFEYKVINSSYIVRVNNITGNVKYLDITGELDDATDEYWKKLEERLKEKRGKTPASKPPDNIPVTP